jgi:hypothetical protein
MCKHVAAVFYGIGARLDDQPELLFRLRKVEEKDLIAKAGSGIPLSKKGPAAHKVLGGEGLSELFGLEMATGEGDSASGSFPAPAKPAGERRAKPRPAVKEIPPVREARASRSAREAPVLRAGVVHEPALSTGSASTPNASSAVAPRR